MKWAIILYMCLTSNIKKKIKKSISSSTTVIDPRDYEI